ncbi:pilus assembly FimT family protein [Deferribacter abyssi]|uniref:pilus assembly FimT family protein n=1 Tax=Deferribacter abyssi TaxID=213806 RepID=UPI003C17E567
MNKNGFTLIELLITITIFSILLSIAIPNYNKWKLKHDREKDLRKLYSIIQQYRAKAFTEKTSFTLVFTNQNQLTIKDDNGNIVSTFNFNTKFNAGNIYLDDRGTLTNTSIFLSNDYIDDTLQYNCIVINTIRIKLGKKNGTKCEAK